MTERLTGRAIYDAIHAVTKELEDFDSALTELQDMRGTTAWRVVDDAREAASKRLHKLKGTYYTVGATPRGLKGTYYTEEATPRDLKGTDNA